MSHYVTPLQEPCWCCGRGPFDDDGNPVMNAGRELCRRCWARWWAHGFAGPGPGPEWVPVIEHAYEYEHVITTLSARAAAEKIGVCERTVTRWRRALRENVTAPG
jgi:hypothetical protein